MGQPRAVQADFVADQCEVIGIQVRVGRDLAVLHPLGIQLGDRPDGLVGGVGAEVIAADLKRFAAPPGDLRPCGADHVLPHLVSLGHPPRLPILQPGGCKIFPAPQAFLAIGRAAPAPDLDVQRREIRAGPAHAGGEPLHPVLVTRAAVGGAELGPHRPVGKLAVNLLFTAMPLLHAMRRRVDVDHEEAPLSGLFDQGPERFVVLHHLCEQRKTVQANLSPGVEGVGPSGGDPRTAPTEPCHDPLQPRSRRHGRRLPPALRPPGCSNCHARRYSGAFPSDRRSSPGP